MSVNNQVSSVTLNGDGATTAFPFSFLAPGPPLATNTLVVTTVVGGVTTVRTYGVDWSTNQFNSVTGGFVNYPLSGSPLPNGGTITITRLVPYTQPTVLLNQGGYFPAVVEGALDWLAMQTQQLAGLGGQLSRSINYPAGDVNPVTVLPNAAARAGLYFTFDGAGNPLMVNGQVGPGGDLSAYVATPTGGVQGTIANLFQTALAGAGGIYINIKNAPYNAVGNGVANDATAINAALTAAAAAGGGIVFVPKTANSYLCSALITVPDGVSMLGEGKASKLKKNYAGDLLLQGKMSTLANLFLDCNGVGGFAGTGVSISTGAIDNISWRVIDNCDIIDSLSNGINFSAANCGHLSVVRDCRVVPNSTATAAFSMPSAEGSALRTMRGVNCGGSAIATMNTCSGATFDGCSGQLPLCSGNPVNYKIVNCEFNHTGNYNFQGVGALWDNNRINIIGNPTFIGGSTANLYFGPANRFTYTGTLTDFTPGTTQANNIQIWLPPLTYPCTWGPGGGGQAIGNGICQCVVQRMGLDVYASFEFRAGTTTTFANAAWSFSAPYPSPNIFTGYAGAAYIVKGGLSILGTCEISPPGNVLSVAAGQVSGADVLSSEVGVGLPAAGAWGVNSFIKCDILYPIQ